MTKKIIPGDLVWWNGAMLVVAQRIIQYEKRSVKEIVFLEDGRPVKRIHTYRNAYWYKLHSRPGVKR